MKKKHKYIFVLGGVMSGVGKGIATASIGSLLSARKYKVNLVKVDPYLNVDAGTMNPTEHGEVFVLDSGLETDQDMGNYERFLGRDLGPEDYMTSGMVYRSVIERERNLGYGGKFVEAIPHVRDEIIDRLERSAQKSKSDISVVEIGGTVGDFQNALFIEAARILKSRGENDVVFVLVSYLPVPSTIGEMKTRPTQHAVRELNSYGVQADVIIARSHRALDQKRKEKIAIWCNVPVDHIISAPDVSSVYDVPLNFEREGITNVLLHSLRLPARKSAGFSAWQSFAKKAHDSKKKVKIGIVGKYFATGDFILSDSYLSVIEAIKYSCYALNVSPDIHWLNARDYERGGRTKELSRYDGIIVPGGFGETGVEGKISAIKYVREHKIPYFGLCYGMQLMVIEYARNKAGLKGAHTAEIQKIAKHLVIDVMPEQKEKIAKKEYGGTMRLGAYPCKLRSDSLAQRAYGTGDISERHRHRFEVNPEYIVKLTEAGIKFSGVSPNHRLMEIAELSTKEHPFMLGTQFHPEFKARPLSPHPLFTEFIKAALKKK